MTEPTRPVDRLLIVSMARYEHVTAGDDGQADVQL
jgi:hypothetical protein